MAAMLAYWVMACTTATSQTVAQSQAATTKTVATIRKSVPTPGSRFATRAQELLGAPSVDKGAWGILIVDAETGATLYEQNADKYFVPASNMKLFTTALALAKLGPDYRFHTTLETRGMLSPEGVLSGDVALVGRGDPNLSNRKFPFDSKEEFDGLPERALAELADALVMKGVKEISRDEGSEGNFRRRHWRRQLFSARTLSQRLGNRRHGLGVWRGNFGHRCGR
jgi:D-alanyl-D-alanine carboxypeptidase/D-alanyl-D-alanine-endopeptidase (penicillin-binding protein 4)